MRSPCVLSLSFLVFTVPFALSGCGSSQMGSSLSGNNSQSGTPPTVSAVAVQVNGVAPNRAQEVQFSEAMDPSTINAQSFQVADSSGKPAQGTVTYDPDYNTASFQPSPALQAGASYTGTITTAVASSGGAHLASPYTFTFTTRATTDTSPITVDAVSPTANATCVSAATAIIVVFNESPDASTLTAGNLAVTGPGGAIAVAFIIDARTTKVVLIPTSPLPTGTINVTVSNVADLAGVKMTAPYTWSFSTACSGGGGPSTQYSAPFAISGGDLGQVAVDTAGNVTVQLTGGAPNTTSTLAFCLPAPENQTPNCFPIGTVSTDANGDGSLTAKFPKSGSWAGDFELGYPSVSPLNTPYKTGYGPNYFSTLQPATTVDGGILNTQLNNAPQAPLKSGTITYSWPLRLFQFVLTGGPSDVTIMAAASDLRTYDSHSIGGTNTTDSAGDVTFTASPYGYYGNDILYVSPQNGEAGWIGGFSVPQ